MFRLQIESFCTGKVRARPDDIAVRARKPTKPSIGRPVEVFFPNENRLCRHRHRLVCNGFYYDLHDTGMKKTLMWRRDGPHGGEESRKPEL